MLINETRPIPCLDEARALKQDYRDQPINSGHRFFREPLVAIAEYGLQGVSYYSQPNNATIDPVEGVSPDIFVRRSVAEKLTTANSYLLRNDDLASLFNGRLELYVREGFRSPALQAYLHDSVMPKLIRSQNPDWTEGQIAARVRQVIAYPQFSETSMPPHFTGGAVDLNLRNAETKGFIDTGIGRAQIGKDVIHTDYLEDYFEEATIDDSLIRPLIARRVLYNVMTSKAIGGVGMANNPTETWHYSLYDQMWAILGGRAAAFYGIPPEIPEELQIAEIK